MLSQLLQRASEISGALTATTQASEDGRRLAVEATDLLREGGFNRMKVPAVLGGYELSPASQMVVLEALSKADSASGWCTMVSNTAAAFLGAYLPNEGIEEVFAEGPDQSMAGVGAPAGKAVRNANGYTVSGRWRLCSGILQSKWVQAGAIVEGEPGAPPVLFAIPTAEVNILDTWNVVGLRGTGSHDFTLDDVFIPEHRTARADTRVQNDAVLRGGPMYHLPGLAFVSYEHTAVALGMGARALDELARILRERRANRTPGSPDREMVVGALGRAQISLQAVRQHALRVQQDLQIAVESGTGPTPMQISAARASARLCTDVALEGARVAFQYGGASSLYLPNSLERALRDLSSAAQHGGVSDVAYSDYGREVSQ